MKKVNATIGRVKTGTYVYSVVMDEPDVPFGLTIEASKGEVKVAGVDKEFELKMEDIERNLDLLFREAFADATEEVSPAVWAGVSRGLAKASAPKVIFPVWLKWASISLAAAAAVALGVFLFTRSGNSNLPIYNNDGQIVADVPAPVTVTETEEVAPPAEEQPSHSANLLASREEIPSPAKQVRNDTPRTESESVSTANEAEPDVIPGDFR